MKTMFISADYNLLGTIQNRLEGTDYLISQVHYTDKVSVEVLIDVDAEEMFTTWIIDITNGKVEIILVTRHSKKFPIIVKHKIPLSTIVG